MCAHFESVKEPKRLKLFFSVQTPEKVNFDVWPTYSTTFIRNITPTSSIDQGTESIESISGSFGLIPHWSKDTKIARHTYNARIETVAEKPAFKDAWRLKRLCIVPAEAIYEPDWRTGKAISTKIFRSDLKPLGIAGIWTGWRSASGEVIRSFSMLTMNADNHSLMNQFHKPDEEKRMVAILEEKNYVNWLNSKDDACLQYIKPFDANLLTTEH